MLRRQLSRLLPAAICASVLTTLLLFAPGAYGQEHTYATAPTGGVHLPTSPLAGQFDATTVTVNPAGLGLLESTHLTLALDLAREEGATRGGPGGGIYYASQFGGGVLPSMGFGISLEWLRPARANLIPDPGTPARLTTSFSLPMGRNASLGLGWHHFYDDTETLSGLDSYDLGWTSRFGAHWAAGLVVRDIGAPKVLGETVQRRYEAELVSRPLGTDRLELSVGGRVGETDVEFGNGRAIDGWLKWSARLARGVYWRGEVGTESLTRITTTGTVTTEEYLRDYRLSSGIEFSFGSVGTTAYGTVLRDADGDTKATGGTLVARISPVQVPSVLPSAKRMERLDLRGGIGERRLTSIVARLSRMAKDDDVVGVFVNLDGATGGWATLREVRKGLLELRGRGKRVFAFMVAGDTRQYFLASAADKIFVDPAGGIHLQGFSATSLYFKGLFDKLGVRAQFEKIEEYKSAPESWTRSGPTPTAYGMRNELYDSIYGTLVADIARSRGISEKRVRALIDNGPYTAGDLEKLPDLVDGVMLPDDLSEAIAREMGGHYRFGSAPKERRDRWDRPKVAVIYIVGDIVGGKSRTIPGVGRHLLGGRTIAQALAAVRADEAIDAVVLRINTPGGSALASEIIAREVEKLRGVKPVICSMGDMAASGGYFAAAYCDRIFADAMTITGSIGIFGGSFDVSGLLSKLGLSWTTYKRGENSDLSSMYRAMDERERRLMKEKLHYFYGRFIGAVAKGRGMSRDDVNKVGRGHVWTGAQSLGINLVDELGGLIDAIDYAKGQAGIGNEVASLVMLPKVEQSLLGKVLGGPFGSAFKTSEDATMKNLQPLVRLMGLLPGTLGPDLLNAIPASIWSEPGQVQARLPFSVLWN
ncbi:MAG: signal peptide peptidase SppA [Myxococcales bacterium]|nr:signal peptide peptidase SppA [Myxococcales bacterium]